MATRREVLRLLLLVQPLMLALTAAQTATTTTSDDASTHQLVLTHEASTLTSITVSWTENSTKPKATAGAGWSLYRVEALNLDTRVLLVSPSINETEYTMPDLAVDTEYDVCVHSTTGPAREPACRKLSTIAVVRIDSLIALLIALAVLGAIILVAVVLWRCAIRRASSPAADDDDDGAGDDDDKSPDDDDKHHSGLNEKSPLLVPATADTDQASPPPPPTSGADPPPPTTAGAQPDDANKPEQPESLYLFLAGHAFK